MRIDSVRHKTLRRLLESNVAKGIIEPERLLDMVAFILAADSFDALGRPPNYGFHALRGDRKGKFAMTVTKNWRLTFAKLDDQTVAELDLEDYH